MYSAPAEVAAADPDRTGRARIRDAAISRFAAHGVKATTLKVIAEDAGVSPALVVHHFGSKAALRRACDEHVAATIREQKLSAMGQGPQFDPLTALRSSGQSGPILRYLARTLGDGSPEVVALIDEMVDDAVGYMQEGVRTGVLKPTEQPRECAVVLVAWSLGALTLHEHINRLLGVDITEGPEGMAAYVLPAAEILSRGILADGLYERLREALAGAKEQT